MTTFRAGDREPPAATSKARSGLDFWLLLTIASALLPLLKSWGAPLGEPVADDFDFLRRALLEPSSWLDSGGAVVYWRPLARQLYFQLLGPLMLAHPLTLAWIHAGLLALAAALIYRALRPGWGGFAAAAAATFPVIADSARVLILWPSAFQDLGALLFSALALHERSRRRLPTALAAILAALLCKEVSLVVAALLPFLPEASATPARERRRWGLGVAAVVAVWGAAYLAILKTHHVLVQSQLEGTRPEFPLRMLWALRSALQDGFNLASVPWPAAAGVALLVALLGLRAKRPDGRRPVAWILWGLAWFALATATLAETYPVWGSFRSTVALAGLGIGCAAALAGQPIWLGALVAGRLVLLLLTPGAPATITPAPPGSGAGFDFATLTRLQRVSLETRRALGSTQSPLPPGTTVLWLHRPLMTERAFAHSKALQVWYRDSTLHWGQWKDAVEDSTLPIGAGLEYEVAGTQQVVTIPPIALRELAAGMRAMHREDFTQALEVLARADSLAPPEAGVFHGMVAGKMGLCFQSRDDGVNARRAAERSLAFWRQGADARYVLAVELATEDRFAEALAQLDTLLSLYPSDQAALILRDTLRVEARGR